MAIPIRTVEFFATLLASDTTREKLHAYVSAPVFFTVWFQFAQSSFFITEHEVHETADLGMMYGFEDSV